MGEGAKHLLPMATHLQDELQSLLSWGFGYVEVSLSPHLYGGIEMPYLDRKNPLLGDRAQHVTGRLGRVTEVCPWNRIIGFGELAIRWDDGVAAGQYAFANQFSLISRASKRLKRIPRNTLADMLRHRFQRR